MGFSECACVIGFLGLGVGFVLLFLFVGLFGIIFHPGITIVVE